MSYSVFYFDGSFVIVSHWHWLPNNKEIAKIEYLTTREIFRIVPHFHLQVFISKAWSIWCWKMLFCAWFTFKELLDARATRLQHHQISINTYIQHHVSLSSKNLDAYVQVKVVLEIEIELCPSPSSVTYGTMPKCAKGGWQYSLPILCDIPKRMEQRLAHGYYRDM